MNFNHGYDYHGGGDQDDSVDVQEVHQGRVDYQVNIRIELRNTLDPFSISVPEFRRLYRLHQHEVFELAAILQHYIPDPSIQANPRTFLPLHVKILCALAFYATGSYQRVLGAIGAICQCQASVSNSIDAVTRALNHPDVLRRFIHFPVTPAERQAVMRRNLILGVPRVLGFVDGTLIKIVPPSMEDNREVYFCRKGYTALNVQIVCDVDLNITNVNASYPGSCNDAYIYRFSGLRDEMIRTYQESRCWLLGDSGYPLEPWLHTPLPRAEEGTPEYVYNRLHCHSRNVVERCIGVLKGRWRCLLQDRTLHYAPRKAGLITIACVVLHNFCRRRNNDAGLRRVQQVRPESEDEEYEGDDHEDHNLRQRALREQRFLINFANRGRRGQRNR